MKYKELEEKILDKAEEVDLLSIGNLLTQANRIVSDVANLHAAVLVKSKGFKEFVVSNNKIVKVDEYTNTKLGSIFYDLIILAEINGVSLEDCLEEVYKNKK